jgi:hypothetical protein
MGAQWKTKGKAEAAAAKGRIFTKLAKEIMVAARNGADPGMNPRLRLAIEQAKKASMPKDTLERAIKKGAGLLDEGVNYEKLTYEGFAPHRVPVIVECLTDNANRTATNIRILFRKGQLGNSGSVSWDFDYLGMIEATPEPPVPIRKSPPSRPAPRIWNRARTARRCFSPIRPTWTRCSAPCPSTASPCSPRSWATGPRIRSASAKPNARKSRRSWKPSTRMTMSRMCMWGWRIDNSPIETSLVIASAAKQSPYAADAAVGDYSLRSPLRGRPAGILRSQARLCFIASGSAQ